MKRTVLALAVVGLVVSSVGVASAKPGNGNGAQKAGLAEASGNNVSCAKAGADTGTRTATGFAVLNAPGKPGSPRRIVGEVAVKDAEPGTYQVRLAGPGTSSCGVELGELVVQPNRRGNASIAAASQGEGLYYVVLTQKPFAEVPVLGDIPFQQLYASMPVTLR